MVKISLNETTWQYDVTLNGIVYTSCNTIEDARREATTAMRQLRYGL